jgi:PRTRC genetic system protein E
MFQELLPLLRQRTVLMIINHITDDELSVSIVPKKLQESENNALCTPLSVSGSPAELDRELPQTIVGFVGGHIGLKQSLDAAKAEMDAAAKAAREEAKNKTKLATSTKPVTKIDTTEKVEPIGPAEPKPEPPKIPSLFDTAPAGGEPPKPDPSAAPAAPVPTEPPKTEAFPPAAPASLPITCEEPETDETATSAEEADAAYYGSLDAA